jgi:hypothetical protein
VPSVANQRSSKPPSGARVVFPARVTTWTVLGVPEVPLLEVDERPVEAPVEVWATAPLEVVRPGPFAAPVGEEVLPVPTAPEEGPLAAMLPKTCGAVVEEELDAGEDPEHPHRSKTGAHPRATNGILMTPPWK